MELRDYADAIFDTVREPLLVLGSDLRVKLANRAFYQTFKVSADKSIGQVIYQLGNGQWDIPSLRKLLDDLLPTNGHFDDYRVECDFPDIGRRIMLLNARRLQDGDNQTKLILLAIEDITQRRRAELEVARQRTWFQTTLTSIGDAVIATDADARATYLNPTAERLTGWSAGDAEGKPLYQVFVIVNEETRKLVESPVSKAIRVGAVVGLANHTVLIAKDGRESPIDDSAAPIHDADGTIAGVVMVFHDITERRQAERQMRSSDEQRRMALDSAELGTWQVDPTTKALMCDQRFRNIFGVPDAKWTDYDPVIAIIHPDDQSRVLDAMASATRLVDPAPYNIEHRIIHSDGLIRWVLAKGRANFAEPKPGQSQRTLLSFNGTVADITDRRRAEEAVETSEIRYRRLFESAHDGILILDTQSRRITDVNPFLLNLLGYPRAYFIGKELWEIGVFSDKAESQTAMQTLNDNGSVRFENKPLQDRNGRRHAVEIVANIYQEDHHSVIQCNIRDISERALFERERASLLANEQASRFEAEAANRAKDTFLATLSHELRTPLTAILAWAVLLRNKPNDAAAVKEASSTIERNARMQAQLIEDVLDVSRIVSGKLRLELRRCELSKIIQEAIASVRHAAEAKAIRMSVEVLKGASATYCDAGRMQQVIWNLLSNAIKFSPKDGTISVRVERANSMTRITIADQGEGITPDFLPHVFERFRQSDGTSTRKHGGLGLGLSIVRHLVEMHGGTVQVQSEGVGKGATFIVNLPVRAVTDSPVSSDENPDSAELGTSAVSEAEAHALVRLDGLRVLVVDDEPDARNVIKAALENAGATVAVADSAATALRLLADVRPNLIISDISMPVQDGYEFMKQIRSMGKEFSGREVPAIALTAYARVEDRRRALLAGFQMHVAKPVDPNELTEVVASLAGRTGLD